MGSRAKAPAGARASTEPDSILQGVRGLLRMVELGHGCLPVGPTDLVVMFNTQWPGGVTGEPARYTSVRNALLKMARTGEVERVVYGSTGHRGRYRLAPRLPGLN